VVSGEWVIIAGSDVREQADRIRHWDYFTPVTVSRDLEVDVEGVLGDCKLRQTARLGAIIQWHSSSTNLRGTSTVFEIGHGRVNLSLRLRGEELGGMLRLDCRVILLKGSSRAPVLLAPQRGASILWSDGTTIALEGQSARFPIQLVDFERAGVAGGSRAAWFLQWRPTDLDAPTLGSVRLLLNRGHPVVARLVSEGAVAPELVAVQSALRHDVARQLIQGALESSEFDRETTYGLGALGTALQGLLDSTFGSDSLDAIRGLRRTSPSDFEARLQAASQLFSDGVG
jgi:hypothetical protein